MLSSIGYGDFLRICSSFRGYDRVYLGWFILDLVWRLFMMKASRWSVKAHYMFGSIGSSLSTGFQVYLSKCCDPYVSPRCTICFFCSFSAFFQHVNLVTTYLRAGLEVYFSFPWVVCTNTKAIGYNFLGSESHFWFFGFFWLIVSADGINNCGWIFVGGWGCWLKGTHQIPSVNWISIWLQFHIY